MTAEKYKRDNLMVVMFEELQRRALNGATVENDQEHRLISIVLPSAEDPTGRTFTKHSIRVNRNDSTQDGLDIRITSDGPGGTTVMDMNLGAEAMVAMSILFRALAVRVRPTGEAAWK